MKNEKALFALHYGIFLLSVREGEKDNGCIINTAMQVTDTPNQLMVAVNKQNYTHDMILHTGRLALSVLSEGAEFSIFQRFGFQSGREVDKFAGLPSVERLGNGLLRLTEGVSAWLTGEVVSTMDLGTHTLFLASVEDGDLVSNVPSATYAYYHAHIKPKPQSQPSGVKKRWVCRVCGYIYEGETLPEDYICPICRHPASAFDPLP